MPMHRLIRTARSTPHLARQAPRPPFPELPSRFLARQVRMPLRRLSATRRSSGRSMARWGATSLVPAARAGNINIVMARPREDRMPCDRLTGIKAREKPPLFRCRLRLRRTPMFRRWCRSILRQNMQPMGQCGRRPSCGRGRTPDCEFVASRRLKGGRSAFCATPAPQSAWLLLRCRPGSVITD
jgi:hypothetical protein